MYQSYMTIQVINFSANLIQLTMKFQFQTNLEEFFYYYLYTSQCSAVHRSRRAGAGVLTYFAGAGAGVCSPPVKL